MFESNLAPKAFKPKEEIIGVIKIVGIFSFVFTIFFAIPIMLLFYPLSEKESVSRSKHVSKGSEEQVLVEKEKGEVSENQINEVTKVDYEYDSGSDIASQTIEFA